MKKIFLDFHFYLEVLNVGFREYQFSMVSMRAVNSDFFTVTDADNCFYFFEARKQVFTSFVVIKWEQIIRFILSYHQPFLALEIDLISIITVGYVYHTLLDVCIQLQILFFNCTCHYCFLLFNTKIRNKYNKRRAQNLGWPCFVIKQSPPLVNQIRPSGSNHKLSYFICEIPSVLQSMPPNFKLEVKVTDN